jgi:hypothetical protein
MLVDKVASGSSPHLTQVVAASVHSQLSRFSTFFFLQEIVQGDSRCIKPARAARLSRRPKRAECQTLDADVCAIAEQYELNAAMDKRTRAVGRGVVLQRK